MGNIALGGRTGVASVCQTDHACLRGPTVGVRLADTADLERWQSFVDSHPDAGCMHHAGWFFVLRDAFAVRPKYLMAVDEHGAIRGILPAYLSRSWFAGNHISSLEDGVLANCASAAEALLAGARKLRDDSGAEYFQLRGGTADDEACWSVSTVRTLIPTDRPIEALWGSVKKKTRWAIRQNQNQLIAIEHDPTLATFNDFYLAYAARMRDLGTPVIGLRAFDAVRTRLGAARLRLYVVRHRSRLIGGMLCIINGARWTDYFAAVRLVPEAPFANYLLYWHVIRDAASLGISRLDLGRSSPGSGVHLFKRKWGGIDIEVPYRFYPAANARPRDMGLQGMKQKKGLAQRLWSQLPTAAANRLGPLVRRQLPFI